MSGSFLYTDLVPNPTSGRSRPVGSSTTTASPSAGADILGIIITHGMLYILLYWSL